jgi:predicted AlkP superfamily pyrophosphatase or phosphodiesterase
MIRKHSLAVVLILCLGILWPLQHSASQRPAERARKPRLVLGIVIDQFRYDYLTRFEDLFGEGGFRRLLMHGAVFTNANYIYVPTVTAPGHATFMSGSAPAFHGIIANEWFERETDRRVESVTDDSVKPLGGKTSESRSPRRFVGSTLGDQLKLASAGKSKVIGIALKDRAAILPAGKGANGAFWYDDKSGEFVSSTYYFPDLPSWVKQFNQAHLADKYFNKKWEKLLPESAYERSQPDDSPFEKYRFGTKFPYVINGGESKIGPKFYEQLDESPFANDYVVTFAKAAIEAEGLGQDEYTDLLTVSFSANDLVGHNFGPYSQEVEDMALRVDRSLADLFSYVDRKVGLANTIIVFTADHGVAPIPEHAQAVGLGGGRIDVKTITAAAETALDDRFGQDNWIRETVAGNIYLDYKTLERRHAKRDEIESVACEAVTKVVGVAECYTRTQLLAKQLTPGLISTRVLNDFYPERNGDVLFILKPYYMTRTGDGTTHGTPYSYDTHVPVIFYGYGIVPGSYSAVSSPSDIAPTLANVLKIEPPSSVVGRVLTEAIRTNGGS